MRGTLLVRGPWGRFKKVEICGGPWMDKPATHFGICMAPEILNSIQRERLPDTQPGGSPEGRVPRSANRSPGKAGLRGLWVRDRTDGNAAWDHRSHRQPAPLGSGGFRPQELLQRSCRDRRAAHYGRDAQRQGSTENVPELALVGPFAHRVHAHAHS